MYYDFIHLFFVDSKVFTKSTIEMIQSIDQTHKHLFVVKSEVSYSSNCIKDEAIMDVVTLEKYCSQARYVILHSLPYDNRDILRISNSNIKKMVWCVWGHDLYDCPKYDNIIYLFLRNVYRIINGKKGFRHMVTKKVQKMNCVLVGYNYDKVALRKKYGHDLKIENALYPTSYFLEDVDMYRVQDLSHDKIRVMVGHSAYSFLNHKKCLKKLLPYKDNIEIYLPLSYGSMEYADEIENFAISCFGEEKIHVYKDFMGAKEYISLLSSIDMAIFDYKHQAAFGNIILLLYLGKKIYLNQDGVMYKGLKYQNLSVFRANDIGKISLEELKEGFEISANIEYGRNLLDKNITYGQWKKVFDDLIRQ